MQTRNSEMRICIENGRRRREVMRQGSADCRVPQRLSVRLPQTQCCGTGMQSRPCASSAEQSPVERMTAGHLHLRHAFSHSVTAPRLHHLPRLIQSTNTKDERHGLIIDSPQIYIISLLSISPKYRRYDILRKLEI